MIRSALARVVVAIAVNQGRGALLVVGGAAVSMTVLAACTHVAHGRSTVGQGRRYSSSNVRYDRFFRTLHELQVELQRAPQAETANRAALAEALRAPDPATETLHARVREALTELLQAGTQVRIAPDGMLEVRATTSAPAGEQLVAAVSRALRGAADLSERMHLAGTRLEQVRSELPGLERDVRTTFDATSAREVQRNLGDARKLLPLMAARAGEVQTASRDLADQIRSAAANTIAPPQGEPVVADPPPSVGAEPPSKPNKPVSSRRPAAKRPPAEAPSEFEP